MWNLINYLMNIHLNIHFNIWAVTFCHSSFVISPPLPLSFSATLKIDITAKHYYNIDVENKEATYEGNSF